MFTKETVVDCRGHLLGRLASTVAKELINGQAVTLVRFQVYRKVQIETFIQNYLTALES
jgi:hypothetical protein